MPDVEIQRKTKKGWTGDATFFGDDAMERAEAALASKRRTSFHHTFRIAPPRREKTYEELALDRFKEEPKSNQAAKRWIMGD